MARGFESKSVADQQEAAVHQTPDRRDGDPPDPARLARRRRLELARIDITRRLAAATAAAHREMLSRALAALDREIAALD